MQKVSISEKLQSFDKYWQSKLVGEFNGQSMKLAKLKGDFDWHRHNAEDEFYLVLKGQLSIEFEKESVTLGEGELFIIPRNTGHRLSSPQDVHVLIIEPKSTMHMDLVKEEKDAESK